MKDRSVLTEKEDKNMALEKSEARLRTIINEAPDAILIIDKDGYVLFANPAAETLFRRPGKTLVNDLFGFPIGGSEPSELEIINRDDMKRHVAEMRVHNIEWDSRKAHLATIRDITQHKDTQKELQSAVEREHHLANHDFLTNLPNRQLFFDRLKHAIGQAKRSGHEIAVLFLDIDKFKQINDSYGHEAGDALLVSVASRLQGCMRECDTIARLGGDEFVIILENIVQIQDVVKVVQKVLNAFSSPFKTNNRLINASTSIGISIYPDNGEDPDTLISCADHAMYTVKTEGQKSYQFYNSNMEQAALNRLELENRLQKAIVEEQLVLHYQPQVDFLTNKVVGVEALVRWQDPEYGFRQPAEFIFLAEESGLIVPLGEWVLDAACRQIKSWQEMGLPPLSVSVNLSPRQFRVMQIKEVVMETLDEHRLKPEYLGLEITESCAIQNIDYTISVLNTLIRMGVKISLDDFGVGYASMNYLKQFPIDVLKIDRTFVNGLHEFHDDWAIISSIISMAKKLKMTVLAEGVENSEQLSYLRALKCDQYQGFFYSRPLPPEKIGELIKRNGAAPT